MYQSTNLNRAQGTWKGMRLKFFLHVCVWKNKQQFAENNFSYILWGDLRKWGPSSTIVDGMERG